MRGPATKPGSTSRPSIRERRTSLRTCCVCGRRLFAQLCIGFCRRVASCARRLPRPTVIKARRAAKAAARAERRPHPQYNDAIAWFEQDVQERDSRYDPIVAQLILSQAAIETTTDLLTQAILEIAQHQEVVEPLRQEVTQVIREGGWKKSSLYDMKLVDSVLRESQRPKPLAMS